MFRKRVKWKFLKANNSLIHFRGENFQHQRKARLNVIIWSRKQADAFISFILMKMPHQTQKVRIHVALYILNSAIQNGRAKHIFFCIKSASSPGIHCIPLVPNKCRKTIKLNYENIVVWILVAVKFLSVDFFIASSIRR